LLNCCCICSSCSQSLYFCVSAIRLWWVIEISDSDHMVHILVSITHIYFFIYVYVCAHACIHTYMHTQRHAFIHAYIHTYIHWYTTEYSKYEETSHRSADWQLTRQRYARSCVQN
jgi:hypothetical protein